MVVLEEGITAAQTWILGSVSWKCFKKELYDQYFLSSIKKQKAKEFAIMI